MGLTNKEVFQGYHIADTCIMSPTYFALILEENEEQAKYNKEGGVRVRFCVHDLEKEKGERWGFKEFTPGWASPIMAHTEPDEFIVVDRIAQVYYFGLGKNKKTEKPLNNYTGGLFGIKNIQGTIYGATVPRIMYKRLGPDQWVEDDQLLHIPGAKQTKSKGFKDIDGFSEKDIYIVGGDRDVWHFDGENWSPVDISRRPFRCTSVVCADDGYVYIGGRLGAIARGRGDEWETYYPDAIASDIKSMVCYRGRVFAGTERETFVIGEDIKPVPYDFEGQLPPMAGRFMYTAYDRMIVANHSNQVAFFDGEKWLNINNCMELSQDEAQMLMNQNLKWLEQTTDDLEELTNIIQKSNK